MRPSRLLLENFGPFRARAEVDFSVLGQVFLVCGQTGSGKTSLFDAMTYALYGKAPGARGGLERQLWSHHARPGDKPLVEFEFFLGGAEYRVTRSPPYRRPAKRGKSDFSDVGPEAAFYRRDRGPEGLEWKLLANSLTEVDAAIEERMGLTEDEFSKIILLPQGEFQRFLEMKSSDRVGVLEKLFPVGLHDAVAVLARDRAKEALAAVQRVDAALGRLGGAAEAEASDAALRELEAEASRLAGEREKAVERLSRAELGLSLAKKRRERALRAETARDRLAALEAEGPDVATLEARVAAARRASRALPAIKAREASAVELERARSARASRAAALAALDDRAGEVEAAGAAALRRAEEAAEADRELGGLAAAQAAWSEAARARKALASSRETGAALVSRAEEAREAEALALASFTEASVDEEEESAIRAAFDADRQAGEAANESLKAAESAAAQAEKAARFRGAAEASAGAAHTAELRLEAAVGSLAALEAAAETDMAVRLSETLKPGEPCPVCGSLEHPSPAHGVAGAPGPRAGPGAGAEDIGRARASKDEALAADADARAKAAAAEEKAGTAEAELLELLLQAGRHESGEVVAWLAEARSAAAAGAESLSRSADRLGEMEDRRKSAARLATALDAARGTKAATASEAQLAAVDVARLEATLAAAVSRAGPEDPAPKIDAAMARRDRASSERERLEALASSWAAERQEAAALAAEFSFRAEAAGERLLAAERDEAEALMELGFAGPEEARAAWIEDEELASLEIRVTAYRNDIIEARAASEALAAEARADADGVPAEEEGLEAEAAAARKVRDELQSRIDAAASGMAALARDRDERARLLEERKGLDAAWSRMSALSALLNGDIQGRRLPFKNFVLGSYFRIVVERASARLGQMSDGRFALMTDEGSGRGKAGLELLVRDAHTGQSRPSGTLSGGERFITSLSLALGLADTIRDRSGGATLDAIFIDEGFGSLDDEALDRAVSVLDEARGTRTIGIVSHVAELKARMPSRIEVSKGRSGSSLRLVY
ncbi:MAG: AAA family ATPase [Rectinemataceae bacterium]|jgi:exonuclease SbcC